MPCTHCDRRPLRGTVAENEHWTMVVNDNQATIGRVFLSLKRHEEDVTALTEAEVAALWVALREARTALDQLFEPDHHNYLFLMNLDAHVHMHLFPRYREPRDFHGQTYADTHFGGHHDPGEVRLIDTPTREALVTALQDALRETGATLR